MMNHWKQRIDALKRAERHSRPRGLVLLLGTLLAVALGYGLGGLSQQELVVQVAHQQQALDQLDGQRLELEKSLAAARMETRLELKSQQDTKAMMARQAQQITALETELEFYRNIMAPEKEADGVVIHDFLLEPTSTEHHYRFRLVLSQQKKRKRFTKGRVTLMLRGSDDGEAVERNLEQLGVDKDKLRFSFRYFQEMEGTFTLAPGLVAEGIRVKVNVPAAWGNKATSSETDFKLADLVGEPQIMAPVTPETSPKA